MKNIIHFDWSTKLPIINKGALAGSWKMEENPQVLVAQLQERAKELLAVESKLYREEGELLADISRKEKEFQNDQICMSKLKAIKEMFAKKPQYKLFIK